MKIQKGDAGYIRSQKKKTGLIVILFVLLVGAILTAGWMHFHTRLNVLTVLAVLLCLPGCKYLVRLVMLLPHRSLDESMELEVSGCTENLAAAYELIITSEKKAMPVEAIVISNHTICGYAQNKKVDTDYLARHIKAILRQNKIEKVTVKIFHDYVAFLSRAEGMNNIAAVEKREPGEWEEDVRQILLAISL